MNKLIDRQQIKIEMLKSNLKVKNLAEILHISEYSTRLKLSGKRGFNETEIDILYSLFGTIIFFNYRATKNEAKII